MLTADWDVLCEEVKIEILKNLVKSEPFPESLIQFSLTSQENHRLVNDWQVWQEALRCYFPALAAHRVVGKDYQPKNAFHVLYQRVIPILQQANLGFTDFIATVQARPINLSAMQLDCLQGLLLITGHPLPNQEAPSLAVLEQAILFAASIGKADFIQTQLEINGTNFNRAIITQALLLAAKTGHLRTFNLLFAQTRPTIDTTILRNSLLIAAEQGHIALVAQFLQPPTVRIISFTLQKVVSIAITQNYPEMLKLVLQGRPHLHFVADIRHAVICAAHNGHTPIIKHTYHLAADAFNDLTVFRLLEIASQQGNLDLFDLFNTHPAIMRSPSHALTCIKIAMSHRQESIAIALLKATHSKLRQYVKRELLGSATTLGLNALAKELSVNEDIIPLSEAMDHLTLTNNAYLPAFSRSASPSVNSLQPQTTVAKQSRSFTSHPS